MHELLDHLRGIEERLQEHNRRIAGSYWRGKVTDVDAAKHKVRLEIGKDDDGAVVKSPWLPVKQPAGALKLHSLPSVGQTVGLHTETGDIEQGVVEAFWWSEDNQSPSDKADEHVLTFGDVTVKLTSGGLTITVGGFTLSLTGSGADFTGGYVKSDGHLIDHDHRHTEVAAGASLSGKPE